MARLRDALVGAPALAQLIHPRPAPTHRATGRPFTGAHPSTFAPTHCAGDKPDSPVCCMHDHPTEADGTVGWTNAVVDQRRIATTHSPNRVTGAPS